MTTLWRTFVSCATCDKSVRLDAKVCPHCGAAFGPDDSERAS